MIDSNSFYVILCSLQLRILFIILGLEKPSFFIVCVQNICSIQQYHGCVRKLENASGYEGRKA